MLKTTLAKLPYSGPFLIVIAVAMGLYAVTWLRLAQEWLKWEQVLAHGLPTFLVFLALILVHPPLVKEQSRENWLNRETMIGGFALIFITLFWIIVELVQIHTLAYLILPVGLLATSVSLLGFKAATSFLPYIGLLSLTLPIWGDLVPILVSVASDVVGGAVRWFGITALVEGNYITLPYGRLVIADGCSGIGYLAVSLVIASVTAILNDYRAKGWLLLVVASIAIALVVNWLRILVLVVVAYYSNMQSDLVRNHELFGWLLFAIFAVPATLLAPVRHRSRTPPRTPNPMAPKGIAFILAAFILGTVCMNLVQASDGTSPLWKVTGDDLQRKSASALPLPLNLPKSLEHSVWQLQEPKIWVSIAQSNRASPDNKLVPYLPDTLGARDWFEIDDNNHANVTIYRHLNTAEQIATSLWFRVGKYQTNSYFMAKLLQIPAIFSGQTGFALINLQVRCNTDHCDEGKKHLDRVREELKLQADIQESR